MRGLVLTILAGVNVGCSVGHRCYPMDEQAIVNARPFWRSTHPFRFLFYYTIRYHVLFRVLRMAFTEDRQRFAVELSQRALMQHAVAKPSQ